MMQMATITEEVEGEGEAELAGGLAQAAGAGGGGATRSSDFQCFTTVEKTTIFSPCFCSRTGE